MKRPAVTIRRTVEDDWHSVRALRLEMLRDTPLAYLESLADAKKHDEPEWRMRAARGSSGTSVALAAIRGITWIGTMGAYVPAPGREPVLVGVYVSPDFRGTRAGVADALLDGIEAWVLERGATGYTLEVHEKNPRARAYYERRGFTLTGRTLPYPLDPSGRELELEMSKTLL